MSEALNFNSVSMVPQIEHNSSDRNNNSENYANPFSFRGNQDGVLETTPEMLRNFLYDIRDRQRYKNGIITGVKEYENIRKTNPGMEVAEQLWETKYYYKYLAPVMSDGYINSSMLLHLCNVSFESQNLKVLEYRLETIIGSRALEGGQREQGSFSTFQQVVTKGVGNEFNSSYQLDTLYENNLQPENLERHRQRTMSQQTMCMLTLIYELSTFVEQQMMAMTPMDYAAMYAIHQNTTPSDLYDYQKRSFEASIHSDYGPLKCDEWTKCVNEKTKTEYDAMILSRLPINYGNKENAIVVSDNNNTYDIPIQTMNQKKPFSLGNDPSSDISGVETNITQHVADGQEQFIRVKTFKVPGGFTFIQDIKRTSVFDFHIEDRRVNADNSLKYNIITYDGKNQIYMYHSEVGIRAQTESVSGGSPTLKKCGEVKIQTNDQTGQVFQTSIRNPGDTRNVTFHLGGYFFPTNHNGLMRRYGMLLTPTNQNKPERSETVSTPSPSQVPVFTGYSKNQKAMGVSYVVQNFITAEGNDHDHSTILSEVPLSMYFQDGNPPDEDRAVNFLKINFDGSTETIKSNLKNFFHQFKVLISNAYFGDALDLDEEQEAKMRLYLSQCMNDDPVYMSVDARSRGNDVVKITAQEAAHLMYAAGIIVQFMVIYNNDYDKWKNMKTIIDFDYEKPERQGNSRKRSASGFADGEEQFFKKFFSALKQFQANDEEEE